MDSGNLSGEGKTVQRMPYGLFGNNMFRLIT